MALVIGEDERASITDVEIANTALEHRVARNIKVGLLMLLSGVLLTEMNSGREILESVWNFPPALLHLATQGSQLFSSYVAPLAVVAPPVDSALAFAQHSKKIASIAPNRIK